MIPAKIVLSCEHAGNQIPSSYESLFRAAQEVLQSHRGWDTGALVLAKKLAEVLQVKLHYTEISRLLVESNRSIENPQLFSEFDDQLPAQEKKFILDTWYRPYRAEVEEEIWSNRRAGERSLHLAIHTFTPELDGEQRNADIGLLFDPERKEEQLFSLKLSKALKKLDATLVVKENYPYKGTDDGFTTYLRKKHGEKWYSGIEIEVNQKFPQNRDQQQWANLQDTIASAVASTIGRSKLSTI